MAERRAHNLEVVGSTPSGGIHSFIHDRVYAVVIRSFSSVGRIWVLCAHGHGFEPRKEHFFFVVEIKILIIIYNHYCI